MTAINSGNDAPDVRVYPLVEAPAGSGSYTARIPPAYPDHGTATYSSSIDCPNMTAVLPTDGPTTGDTTVTITGDGLNGTIAVLFGTTPATNVQVVNDNTVTATAPPGTGTVDITLEGSYGTIFGTDLLKYDYLSVQNLSATSGPPSGGNMILITGTGFYHAVGAYFGENPALYVIPVSDTEMYAGVPPGAGTVDVRVLTGGGLSTTTSADPYTYSPAAQTVVAPQVSTTAPPGPTDSTADATFNGAIVLGTDVRTADPATIASVDSAVPPLPPADDSSAGQTPALPPDTQATLNPVYRQIAAPGAYPDILETLEKVLDTSELAAETIDLGYQAAGSTLINASRAAVLEETNGIFRSAVKALPTGNGGPVFDTLTDLIAGEPESGLASLAPEAESLGNAFAGAGEFFSAAGKYLFVAGQSVNFYHLSTETAMIAAYYAQELGAGTKLQMFSTVVGGALGGAGFGAITACVYLEPCGLAFAGVTAVAYFGATCYENATCKADLEDIASAEAALGSPLAAFVSVVFHVLIDPSGQVFDAQGAPVAGATATLLTGPSSAGPFSEMPTGGGLVEPATNPEATDANGTFDWDAAPGWYEVSASAPGCTDPHNSSNTTVLTNPFELPPPAIGLNLTLNCPNLLPPSTPTVTALSTSAGPAAGGGTVDVEGTGFTPASVVDFGHTQAKSVTLISSSALQVGIPAGSGSVDLTVNTQGGTSQTSVADVYNYLSVPAVSGLSASSGPSYGGSDVEVTGSGFTSGSEVYFGTTPAAFVSVFSPTKIDVIAPAGSGTVDVIVATDGGTSVTSSADKFTYTNSPPPSGGTTGTTSTSSNSPATPAAQPPKSTTTATPTSTPEPPAAATSTISLAFGGQRITLAVPSTNTCLPPSATLKVTFKAAPAKGSKNAALKFNSATLYLDKGVKHTRKVKSHGKTITKVYYTASATIKMTSETLKLALKGYPKGTHSLKVIVAYTETVKPKTTQALKATKTLTAKVNVC